MSQTLIVPEDIVQAVPEALLPLDDTDARRRYGHLLQTSHGAVRALSDLQDRFAQDTDWATASDRFRAEVDATSREFAQTLADDQASRATFQRDFTTLAESNTAAFKRAVVMREKAALGGAYDERMHSLELLAQSGDSEQRGEILRQAALEAHRAQAFGLEADPGSALERFASRISSSETPGMDLSRTGQSFGSPASSLLERDRDHYTAIQNAGEPREARTPEVIGEDYWAAKKALDVDPNDKAAQKLFEAADGELDSYVAKSVIANVLGGKMEKNLIGLDRVAKAILALFPPPARAGWQIVNIAKVIHEYEVARKSVEKIRSGK